MRNEAENIAPLVAEIAAALAGRAFEVIYVNDGSTDGTEAELNAPEGAASLASPDSPRAFVRAIGGAAHRNEAARAGRSSSRSTATARTIRRFCPS